MADPYPDPVAELARALGESVDSAALVSDRRGSRAWDVRTPTRRVALKANDPESHHSRDKAAEIDREVRVLTALGRARGVPSDYLVAHGTHTGGTWLAVRWISGNGLWKALTPAREADTPANRALLAITASTLATAIDGPHRSGWTHADVQPTNVRVGDDGTAALIDYALACHPDDGEPRAPYRGALTHTTAPELAGALLGTPDTEHVEAQPAEDIWALGASLFWCWTGLHPVDYRDPQSERVELLRDIADGRIRDLGGVRPWRFPGFEEVIVACLDPVPTGRPSVSELVEAAGNYSERGIGVRG